MVKSLLRGEMERMEDLRLLRRYAKDGCAASFEAVVRKHIGWVYSSSVRQVGDPELAQDVTQAVFILLARRAATLSDQTILTGWLFNTLRFTAREARRKEARRRKHESRAALTPGARTADAPAPDDIDDQAWETMAPLLDDAVTALSESDRQAVLLRFYEGRDFAEIAELLGVNEGAARKRVSRAVQRLGRYFKKRGVSLPLAALAATLLARTSDAAPFGLPESVVTTVTGGATLTPLAATLLRRTTLHLLHAKRRLASAVAAVMAMVGVAVTGVVIAGLCESPDTAPLETESPLPWASRISSTPSAPDTLVLPADTTRGRLIIQTAPPPGDRNPAAPKPLAAGDALWWVRQWLNPAHAPTPDTAAAQRAADDAKAATAAANSIDPATGLPRPNPNASKPGDYVESYAQMGGGGGPTVAANPTRSGAPVGGELNGATARSANTTADGGLTLASNLTQTVLASPGSATADAATPATPPGIVLVANYDRRESNTQVTGTLNLAPRSAYLTWLARRSSGIDIVFNSPSGSSAFVVQYGSEDNSRISVIRSGDTTLLEIAYDEDGVTKSVVVDPRHLDDSREFAQLPPDVRDSINVITPLVIPSPRVPVTPDQGFVLTATAVPEPTTHLLLSATLLALTTRRRRRRH